MNQPIITIIDPDDPYDMPIYEGTPEGMPESLVPGTYTGTYRDDDDEMDIEVVVDNHGFYYTRSWNWTSLA